MTGVPAQGRYYDDVATGQVLGPLVIPITRTLIVAGALASRDYEDVHHDPVLAARRGAPDIFMNILTTNGLVGRFVTDWTGPPGLLRRVAIRLGVPNYPDDTMTLTGQVVAMLGPEEADRGVVQIDVRGATGWATTSPAPSTCRCPAGPGPTGDRARRRGAQFRGPGGHRRYRGHRVLQELGPFRAPPGRRGGGRRPRGRRTDPGPG